METFREIETVRPQLFRIACITMLDDNAMNNYLIRDKRSIRLETLLRQLTAIRIVFGALLGISDRPTLTRLGLPQKLEGHIIHRNINNIIQELRNTMFVKTLGIRLQTKLKGDNKLKKYLYSKTFIKPNPTEVSDLMPALLGLINCFMKEMFLCGYVALKRYKKKGRKYSVWKLSPFTFPDGRSVIEITSSSLLCTDTEHPGHPRVPFYPFQS